MTSRAKWSGCIGRPLEIRLRRRDQLLYPRAQWGHAEGINHLRIGENILLAKDLQIDWGIRGMDYLQMDAFTLRAEIIELRRKPTYPQGEFAIDAFGHKAGLYRPGRPSAGARRARPRRRG